MITVRALTSTESPIIFDTLEADKNTDETRMCSHARLSIETDCFATSSQKNARIHVKIDVLSILASHLCSGTAHSEKKHTVCAFGGYLSRNIIACSVFLILFKKCTRKLSGNALTYPAAARTFAVVERCREALLPSLSQTSLVQLLPDQPPRRSSSEKTTLCHEVLQEVTFQGLQSRPARPLPKQAALAQGCTRFTVFAKKYIFPKQGPDFRRACRGSYFPCIELPLDFRIARRQPGGISSPR